MKDVMLDLETLGNGENKCVIQIGACYFDRLSGEIGQTFKRNVDAISAVAAGFELDAKTVYWWLAQSDHARNSILAEPRLPIAQAFTELNEFLAPATQIWSHATFDFVTIMETYRKLRIEPLFGYRTARDIRTLMDLNKIKVDRERTGVHHDALDDCFHQVKYCVDAFRKLDNLEQAKSLIAHIKSLKDRPVK